MFKRFAENAIRRFGFEHPITIFACRLADLTDVAIADISDCPFTPDAIDGRPVLAVIGNKVIVG